METRLPETALLETALLEKERIETGLLDRPAREFFASANVVPDAMPTAYLWPCVQSTGAS
jgi:hypothetical protein